MLPRRSSPVPRRPSLAGISCSHNGDPIMILGDITLAQPYTPGSGSVALSSPPDALSRMDMTPSRITIFRRGDLSVHTTYKLISAERSGAKLSTVLDGVARSYAGGAPVLFQGATADI